MQSPLIGPGMAIAQEYLIRQQIPSPAGDVMIFLADYRGQDCLLEVWRLPPGWVAADWAAAVEELLGPWGALRHDQVAAGRSLVAEGQVCWVRSVVAGSSCAEMLVPKWAEADVKILLKELLELLKYLHDRHLYHGAIALDSIVLRESDSAPVLVGANGGVREAVKALGEDRDPEILDLAASQKQDLYDLAIVMLQLLRGSAGSVSARIPGGLDLELAQVLRSMLQSRTPVSIGALARRLGRRGDWREVALPWLVVIFGIVVLLALWRLFQLFKPPGIQSPIASETVPMTQIKAQPDNTEVIGAQGFEGKLKQALGPDRDRLKELNLSEEARSGMGSYYRRDYERWLGQLSPFGMSEKVVETLTDAQFFWMFPSLRGKALDPRVLGQLWYGMAHDQIEGVAQKRLLAIVGEAGVFQDKVKLAAGQGKVYQIKLNAKQGLDLKLSVSQGEARLTVVNGELFLLKYSSERSFSVPALPSGKTYVVIVTPSHKEGAEIELEVGRS
jgi:hypothetical protein